MPQSDTAFEEFQSRKYAYGELWDGLVNKDSPLVHGIYGMAGVGKTRMMEKIWEDAMKRKMFDKVVRVYVGSESSDEFDLQDQIADFLECKLVSRDVGRRASQLENSLRYGGKILLILDDVWREIRLDYITGTLFKDGSSSNGSKILLTSRDIGVCSDNKCGHLVEVKTLRPDEALDLFMKTVGPDTNSLPDQSLVKKVCDECGQLPLVILAVGKALKRKRHHSWVDALDQLREGEFEKIHGVPPRVYAGIKLSIDHLEHDAKACLFLCCLFPKAADIDMKMLIQLATCSQLIRNGESRVLAMVDTLKESSLLLDSGRYHETKVHDIIRGVAKDVAFRDLEYAFLQERCKSQYLPSKQNYRTRKLLRLDAETDDVHFDEDRECPDLHTLWLQCNNHTQQFSDGFFQMFKDLGCLMLQNVHISLEKFSLQRLGNLLTLILLNCDIRNTDVSLFPKKLKTLYICDCHLPSPLDVANLKCLQKLEIQVPPWQDRLVLGSNVISSLSGLEELHIPKGYSIDRIATEISELTYLKSLQFHFYDVGTFQVRNVFPHLDRYKVSVGVPDMVHFWEHYWERDGIVPSTKSIVLYGKPSQSWEGLMARAEQVILGNSDVEVSSICNGHKRAFEHLERLYISECDKMGHLARFSHSLQHGATCFSKLTILKIMNCTKLKYLFCNKIAKSLAQLQELMVSNCESMEAIILNEGTTDAEIIIFPRLKSLKIDYLVRLANFYAEKKNMDPGSTLSVDKFAEHQPFFDGMAAFPWLEKLAIYGLSDTSVIWGKDCFNNDNVSSMLHRLNNLEYVDVSGCRSLRTMFPSSVASDLTHLKKLIVYFCSEMREIIEAGESAITDNGLLFPEMIDLSLCDLPSLTSFWSYESGKANIGTVPLTLPQLSSISLRYLPQLTRLFHGANFEFHVPALKQEQVKVSRCALLEHIFEDVRVDKTSDMKSAKKAKTVIELTATGKDYRTGGIANLPLVKKMPKSDTAFEEFQSRKDVYEMLWEGLVNKDSPLVHGIYGMAGVGKTRMMEQLWEDAMKKQIFNKVVRVNVGSEYLDEYELQDQIAARLDCKLESQDVERRASQLENSLRKGGKILLILDDVWREIPLGHLIGTSFKDGSVSNGSKILLTSRDKRVCEVNNCEHPVEVITLSPDEALDLFMKTVGPDTINSLPDQSLVKKMCDECGQLPLLILAVGKALESKRHNSWVDALNQLQKGKFKKIPGVDPRVYAGIRLSIDYLEQDDAKSCLFLCCLFPEDADIDMKMLIQLATGSQLIGDGESRVLAMVYSLKESSLLLDSGEYYETKVHDIIRDVALDVAFSGYAFLQVKCNSWYFPSDDAGFCTRKLLRLDVETDDVHFEEHPVFSDLHTLWLQCNNHPQQFLGGFFRMFANLRFLMLQDVKISLEQFSLQPLGKLGTLSLINCDISKTDVSLFPKSLETLCISFCKLPSPLDLANLKYLRKLEIQEWSEFVMGSNVISSLSSLEELHIPNGYINDLEEYKIDPIVTEISELTRLKSLQFHFYLDDTFRGRIEFSDIDGYIIFVGVEDKVHYWNEIVPSAKSVVLYGNHSKSWEGLMARAEEVILGNSDVEVSSIYNGHRGAFEHLERLYISECDKMGHLVRFSHSIQHGATCFSKLTILKIEDCSELKYLFCNKIAKSLAQLQELMVSNCESMEAIIMNEGTGVGEIIKFTKLKSLIIDNVPRLASFYAEKKNMDPRSTLLVENFAEHHPFFDGMAAFPCLEKLAISGLGNTSVIWGKDCFHNDNVSSFCKLTHVELQGCQKLETAIPQAMLNRLNNLEYVHVRGCGSLRTMFPFSVASDLTHLKKLEVNFCNKMREIIEAGESTITYNGLLFPEMTHLSLDGLRSLRSFWCYQSGKANIGRVPLTLPQLSSISLHNLPQLTRLFHGANFEFHAPALKQDKVKVSGCPLLEHIFEDVRVDKTSDIVPRLAT